MRRRTQIDLPFQQDYVLFDTIEIINKESWVKGTCICGAEVKRNLCYLLHTGKSRTISCGCKHPMLINNGNKAKNWRGCGDLPGYIYQAIKKGAKSRNRDFDVSIEYLWSIYEKQNRLCALSNIPIIFPKGRVHKSLGTASLDRIDSSKGYVEGNVQWVHKTINMMKQSYSQDEFIYFCKLVCSKFS